MSSEYTILDFMIDAELVLSGSEGRRIVNHDAVMIFPKSWQADDPLPGRVKVIRDPNYILDKETVLCIVRNVYRFKRPGEFELLEQLRRLPDTVKRTTAR